MRCAGDGVVQRAAGFTLLEILLVMTLAALVLTVVPVSFNAMVPHAEHKAAVSRLVSALRAARGLAVRERHEVTLILDLQYRRYHLRGSEQLTQLPDSLSLHVSTPFHAVRDAQTVAINFFPDGSSSGALIEMGLEDETYQVEVDWLSGRVRYRETG